MKHQLSRVDCSRGAPMGRASKDIANAGPVKLHLEEVKLDSGGYDSGGAYWGIRFPIRVTMDITPPGAQGRALHTYTATPRLYRYYWSGNITSPGKPLIIEGFLDAFDRARAKQQIRTHYPQATFYR